MITIIALITLVAYEPDEKTFEIDVYDYTEKNKIEVICPEGVIDSDCLEPREEKLKDYVTLEDIQNCASSNNFF